MSLINRIVQSNVNHFSGYVPLGVIYLKTFGQT